MRKQIFYSFAASAFYLCAFGLSSIAQTAPLTNSVMAFSTNAYTIDSQSNPTLTLQRGSTYVFQVSVLGHPFFIKTNSTTGPFDQYTNGVSGNGVTSGNLVFVVPGDAPNLLHYHCGNHAPMGGMLNIIDTPAPPVVTVFSITLAAGHIVIESTGATNWTAIPEFNSNLTMNAWATVPGFTNGFANNTNTTGFDQQPLDAVCGPDVFIRVRNQSN